MLTGISKIRSWPKLGIMKPVDKKQVLKELMIIPGVGKSIAEDLWNIGIRSIADLKGKKPEALYQQSNSLEGVLQDRCLLYVYRCAVYFAETEEEDREQAKLQWWNWMDK